MSTFNKFTRYFVEAIAIKPQTSMRCNATKAPVLIANIAWTFFQVLKVVVSTSKTMNNIFKWVSVASVCAVAPLLSHLPATAQSGPLVVGPVLEDAVVEESVREKICNRNPGLCEERVDPEIVRQGPIIEVPPICDPRVCDPIDFDIIRDQTIRVDPVRVQRIRQFR